LTSFLLSYSSFITRVVNFTGYSCVDSSRFLCLCFFNFILQYWIDWESDSIIVFQIAFYIVITVFCHEFGKLTQVYAKYFFIFFQCNPWKLKLNENWNFYIFFICFLSAYHGFMAQSHRLGQLTWVFIVFLVEFYWSSSFNIELIGN
jgi:hypothetical protein